MSAPLKRYQTGQNDTLIRKRSVVQVHVPPQLRGHGTRIGTVALVVE
jgi:hypothetical protein